MEMDESTVCMDVTMNIEKYQKIKSVANQMVRGLNGLLPKEIRSRR
jgi:hypothetical protein